MTVETASRNSHTPGPWSVGDEDEGFDGVAYVEVHAGRYMDASFRSVARIQADFINDAFQTIGLADWANARLIAAAPELLAALTDTMEALAMCQPQTAHGARCQSDAMLKARAAIAKAGA